MTTKFAIPTLTAAALLCTPLAFAQDTGVSHPELLNDSVQTAPAPPAHYAKPSPAVPMPAETPAPTLRQRETYSDDSAYHPLNTPVQTAAVRVTDNSLVVTDDINSGIVGETPSGPNELPSGTLLKAKLVGTITTRETAAESHFTATLVAPVLKHGVVMLPIGTVVSGRVTEVRGGRRVGGPAAIHLQPDIIKLPGGMAYELDAEVIDLDNFADAHVNHEGTIVSNDHPGETAAKIGGTAGGGALMGAMFGGGVGAVVGAGIGAGIGTIWWLKQDHQQTLSDGMSIVFSLDKNLQVAPATH